MNWIAVIVLTLFLLEGFVLSVFPEQFKQMLAEAEPRTLQIVGTFETLVAVGLIAAMILL